MPAVMRACAAVEHAGVPAVAIGGEGFAPMGQAIAKGLGIPRVPIVTYPGPILADPPETFAEKADGVADEVIAALTGAGSEQDAGAEEDDAAGYEPRTMVVSGTLDAVQEHFHAKHWTDGLPIVPPTAARIDAFLAHTRRDSDEVIGVLPPSQREATVYNAAVNGVMAGCRPGYFPMLLAIVEALADPDFRIEDAGSTPGWEPLVTVSGPLAKALDFNSGTAAMRVGRQANTSVGRFVRLYMTNVPGFYIPPGSTDQGALAYTFNVALAEDDDAVAAVGWKPHRVEQGFAPEDTVITLRSVVNVSAPIYSGGSTASDHLKTIGQLFGNAIGPWVYLGLNSERWHPLLVMTPYIARAIAADGWDKDDVRRHLYENVRIRAGDLDDYSWQAGSTDFSLAKLDEQGLLPPAFRGDDPDRLVPMFLRPDWIEVVVAGNPSRNQSKAYVGNHGQGVPVTKLVER